MCSIAGSLNRKEVETMLQTMKHRSPDEINLIVDKFFMGMGRLTILDTKSPGLCPYGDEKIVLSFNGEIYNFIELREELKGKGFQFRTTSDTEVLAKAYQVWGLKMFDKLNGMFAFAILENDKIILARDIAGEKPLYYIENPFRFASEAKALNWDCAEFPPAHYGVYDIRKKKLNLKQYWKLEPKEVRLKTADEELEWLLEDSIKLRTRSDVPYGLYFSGGVDSSLIASFHDFKYKFNYKNKNYAREFRKTMPKICGHLNYPTSHFSPFGFWKLAEQASKKVKVILSGEGADELFGGYVRYVQPHFNYLAQKAFPSYNPMFSPAESVSQAGWREFYGNFQQLLRIGDRMAGAWGIENRCPFLDKRIIQFAFSIPDELKINGLETKVILKKILKRRNPKWKDFEKEGMFIPVYKWFGQPQNYDKTKWLVYQMEQLKKFR